MEHDHGRATGHPWGGTIEEWCPPLFCPLPPAVVRRPGSKVMRAGSAPHLWLGPPQNLPHLLMLEPVKRPSFLFSVTSGQSELQRDLCTSMSERDSCRQWDFHSQASVFRVAQVFFNFYPWTSKEVQVGQAVSWYSHSRFTVSVLLLNQTLSTERRFPSTKLC